MSARLRLAARIHPHDPVAPLQTSATPGTYMSKKRRKLQQGLSRVLLLKLSALFAH